MEQICTYLQNQQMSVDLNSLISCYKGGLSFRIAKTVFEENRDRYQLLVNKLQDPDRAGFVRFNAFMIDIKRYRQRQTDLLYRKQYAHDL